MTHGPLMQRLDPDMHLQDAAATATGLLEKMYDGRISWWNDDAAWEVQSAAVELMDAIARLERNASEYCRPERPVGPSQFERL